MSCFYRNRVRRQLLARRSADHGKTWDRETVLRDDYASPENDVDLGHPRAVQRADWQRAVWQEPTVHSLLAAGKLGGNLAAIRL